MTDSGLPERMLVVGSRGQLGAAFVARLSPLRHVAGVDLDELDITDAARVREAVRSAGPGLILNCAAFNDVDGAETRALDAYRVNGEAIWTLASVARESGAVLVHYSSEFVYDGRQERPYTEDDDVAPQSVYGATKLIGERYAAAAPRHYVLRLSSLYGGHTGRTTIDWIVRQGLAGAPVRAFADRTVSPSYVPDVVEATLGLVGASAPFGLYNSGSPDWCTWADIAERVLAFTGRPDLLERVPFANTPGRAVRPQHCAMSSAKLGGVVRSPRPWREALDAYLAGRAPGAPGG